MQSWTFSHEIECGLTRFWEVYFDREYYRRMYTEGLGFDRFALLSQTENAQTIHRSATAMPKIYAPPVIMRLIGDAFTFVEEGTFERARPVWDWRIVPSVLADRITVKGTTRAEPIGPDRVRRVIEMSIDARLPGVGGVLESFGEKQYRSDWDKTARFMNAYLRERGRAEPQGASRVVDA